MKVAQRGIALASPFVALIVLQGTLYAAYGVESPFLPSVLIDKGLSAAQLGMLLAAATMVRIAAGPIAGRLADRFDAARMIVGCAAAAAGIVSFAYLAGSGFWPLLGVAMMHAVFIAPLAPLADALTLVAAAGGRSFQYGWVRGGGSAAFVVGTLAAGQSVAYLGLGSVIVASGLLFIAMAASVFLVPRRAKQVTIVVDVVETQSPFSILAFRRIVLVAALVIGSHALNDTFAVIRWREAGIGSGTASLLWSAAVASEVVVFLSAGPWLLSRIGPARAAMLAAACGMARWAVMATTAWLPLAAAAQMTHGITFALLHLAAMRIIADVVPQRLAATAQTFYGTFGLGIASAILTASAGVLYGVLGAGSFWIMSGLCAAALPLAAGLKAPKEH